MTTAERTALNALRHWGRQRKALAEVAFGFDAPAAERRAAWEAHRAAEEALFEIAARLEVDPAGGERLRFRPIDYGRDRAGDAPCPDVHGGALCVCSWHPRACEHGRCAACGHYAATIEDFFPFTVVAS